MSVATANLLGQFPGSQVGVVADILDNQLEAAVQQSVESRQDSRGVESYLQLSGGLGGSPAGIGSSSNPSGLGVNGPTDPYDMSTASDGVQVSLSLLPSIHRSDQPNEHRRCPGPDPYPKVFLSTTLE